VLPAAGPETRPEGPLTPNRTPPEPPDDAPPERRGPGRPRYHTEAIQKAPLQLRTADLVYLDRLAADIRDATGAVMNRSSIARALFGALRRSEVDLRQVRGEEDLEALLRSRLGG
jgi:hypothetical protein